jgi:hypothetical protein
MRAKRDGLLRHQLQVCVSWSLRSREHEERHRSLASNFLDVARLKQKAWRSTRSRGTSISTTAAAGSVSERYNFDCLKTPSQELIPLRGYLRLLNGIYRPIIRNG